MRVSVIIPVWHGADVLQPCLDALSTHSGEPRPEVICVDNSSRDNSATLLEQSYPWVRLIRQPVNLGFAGGVNVGLEAAAGELLVLLNQDCVVQPGWLDALRAAFDEWPALGVAGCTMVKADGSLDHAGASVRRPDAAGIHLTELATGRGTARWIPADYVTGAAMAIRRATWETVGRFDEGFYPAYYEDADYCYRARWHGLEIGYVPGARVMHLFSGQAWKTNPLAHTIHHHRSRYRFVAKHFSVPEIAAFLAAETSALEEEAYLDQALARAIAARDTLHSLPGTLELRRADLGEPQPALPRQMAVALAQIRDLALAANARLLDVGLEKPPLEAWLTRNEELAAAWSPGDAAPGVSAVPVPDALDALRDEQNILLDRLHLHPRHPAAEAAWRRGLRHTILRALSLFTGREDILQTRLHALHGQQLEAMSRQQAAMAQQIEALARQLALLRLLLDERQEQAAWQWGYEVERLKRRVELLETLARHE